MLSVISETMNLLKYISSPDPQSSQLETTQRCFRNTVRVIQEAIQHASTGQTPILLSKTNISINLKQLGQVFSDKNHTTSLDFMLKSNCVDTLVTLSINDCPKGLLSELLLFLGNIIREMPIQRIVGVPIHRPLMKILWQIEKIVYVEECLQLIHALTSKIRMNPQLFHIFFYKMTYQVKQSLIKSMKNVKSLLAIKEDEWFCPLVVPLLLNLHQCSALGDVSRHALVDLLCITDSSLLDALTLQCWIKFLFNSDLSGQLYTSITSLWTKSTQLVTDLQNDQLPEDSLINCLLLIEQLERIPISLVVKLECLSASKEAFLFISRDIQQLVLNISNVANEVRLRKSVDLLAKIAIVLTSKADIEQYKAEYICISRVLGNEGDFSGDTPYSLDWKASLGRLFVEIVCIGTDIGKIEQLGDFKQSFEDVMELKLIQIPHHDLPTSYTLEMVQLYQKYISHSSVKCPVSTDKVEGILKILFSNLGFLQQSPIFIRYKYLLMVLVKNHCYSFISCMIPELNNTKIDYLQYQDHRDSCWHMLAEIGSELGESITSRLLNNYMRETVCLECRIYRCPTEQKLESNDFLMFICHSLESLEQKDHHNALILFSIANGLCLLDFKVSLFLFDHLFPICAKLLEIIKPLDVKNTFKRVVYESCLELIAIWRQKGHFYIQ